MRDCVHVGVSLLALGVAMAASAARADCVQNPAGGSAVTCSGTTTFDSTTYAGQRPPGGPTITSVTVGPNATITSAGTAISLGDNARVTIGVGATVDSNSVGVGPNNIGANTIEVGGSSIIDVYGTVRSLGDGMKNTGQGDEAINPLRNQNRINVYSTGRLETLTDGRPVIWFQDLSNDGLDNTVINNGVIRAGASGTSTIIGNSNAVIVRFENGATGKVEGNLDLGGGADLVVLRGGSQFSGSIKAGGGNDIVEMYKGATFTGSVDGGDGVNTLSLLGDAGDAGSSSLIPGSVSNFSAVNKGGTSTWTISGSVSGLGSSSTAINVNGGTLVLSGNNVGYQGTTTIAAAGTLQIGDGGGQGDLPGAITNNGVLTFNRTGTLTVPGAITGTGLVRQVGPGDVTLTGALTNVSLTVEAGRLTLAGGSTLTTGGTPAVPGGFATAASVTGGTLANAGTITANRTANQDGVRVDGAALVNSGTITASASGVFVPRGATLTNTGAITGFSGVFFGGGAVDRGLTLTGNGSITGNSGDGIQALNVASDVTLGTLANPLGAVTGSGGNAITVGVTGTSAIGLVSGGAVTGGNGRGVSTSAVRGATTITQVAGTIQATGDGVNATAAGGAITIDTSGGQIGSGTTSVGGAGIGATQSGGGPLTVTSGTIYATGIGANLRNTGGGAGDIALTANGSITAANGSAIVAQSNGSGTITLTTAAGTTLSAGLAGNAAVLAAGSGTGAGLVQVTNNATITRPGAINSDVGIDVSNNDNGGAPLASSPGATLNGTLTAIAVTNTGTITNNFIRAGIQAIANSAGVVSVTNSGSGIIGGGASGISALNAGAGGVIVANAGRISGGAGNGITARATGTAGSVTVSNTNTIGGAGTPVFGVGITAAIDNTGNAGTVSVDGAGVVYAAGNGINASTTGTGAVTLGGVTPLGAITSGGTGINAAIANAASTAALGVTSAGLITAGSIGIGAATTGGGTVTVSAGPVTTANGSGIVATGRTGLVAVTANGAITAGGAGSAGIVLTGSAANNTVTVGSSGSVSGEIGLRLAGGGTTTLSNGGSIATSAAFGNAIQIDAGTLVLGAQTGTLTGNLAIGGAGGTLTVSRAADLTLTNTITGAGTFNQNGTGRLTLAGANGTDPGQFTGTANVNAGTLAVNGTFGDTDANSATVNVNTGGTLHGSGRIAGSVNVASGATVSAGNSPGTLTVAGNYGLTSGATSLFELGTPNVVGGATNDLIVVGGNLTLAGTLRLVDSANAAAAPVAGTYRLFNYGGTLSGSFGTVSAPTATSATVYTTIPNQVNLLVFNAGQVVQYWDGSDTTGAGAGGQGGTAVWNGANTNWTASPTSTINAAWASGLGIFAGTAGTVTVAGAQNVQGLQFTADGYRLTGAGTLNLTGDPFSTPTQSFVNVDGGVGATIANALTSTGGTIGLNKLGNGTLTLAGANTYTGATSVTAGTLVLAAGGSLASNVAVANGAAFTNAGTLTAGLTNAGTAANSGTVAGLVTNTAGTLTNTGTLNGGATITGGTLVLGSGSIVNGALANAAAVTAQGQINGTVTNGAGARVTLTGPLTGIAGFANEGTLSLASNDLALGTLTGTGTGAVVQNGGGTDATLTVGSGNASGSYAGILRDGVGPGRLLLAKTGSGTLTLSGANTYTGATSVTAGTLVLAAGGSLASNVAVANGAAFTNAGTLTAGLTNAGTAANSGTVAGLVTNTAGTLTNTGTLNGGATITGGTLVLGSGSIVNGALANAATVTAQGQINGTVTNGAGARVTLTGPLTGITGFANEGTLSLASNDLALGTLTGTGTGAVVQNGGSTDATLTVGSGNASGSYAGILRDGVGPGRLLFAKTGNGTLTLSGANTYTGATSVTAGTLVLASGGSLTSDVTVANGAAFTNAGTLTAGLTNAGTAANSGTVAGLVTNTAGTLTNTGTLNGGATVTGGTLALGSGSILNGALANSAAVTAQGQINGTVTNGAGARVTLTGPLTGITGFANEGTLSLAGNDLALGTLTGTGAGAVVQNGGGTDATLTVGSGNASGSYAGVLRDGAGPGRLLLAKTGSGTLTLTGTNSASNGQFTGTVNVDAGTLAVNGTFGDTAGNSATVNVNNGGTLQGSGTVAGSVFVNGGGTVTAANPLTVGGNYTVAAGSNNVFRLSTPNVVGGATNDLITVGGALAINGGTASLQNVSASGLYRLYDVTGAVTTAAQPNAGFDTVTATNGTASVYAVPPSGTGSSQVNARVSLGGQIVQYWDGTDLSGLAGGAPGAQGGSGVWNATNANWTDDPAAGQVNQNWQGQFGVFTAPTAGGASTVTVEGRQNVQGLQFAGDGYTLTPGAGGSLNLTGDPNGLPGFSTVRVDNGVTATIGTPITGAGLNKAVGSGTLILTGTNSFGALAIADGTVEVRGGAAIADAAPVTLANVAGARLLVTNSETIGSLAGGGTTGGTVAILAGQTLTTGANNASTRFDGSIGGAGALTKTGSGTFTLTGANTFGGGTTVANGTLVNTGSLASGVGVNATAAFVNNGTLAAGLANAGTSTNTGTVAGLVTNTAGTLTNTGTLNGGASVTGGTLVLGSGSILNGALANAATVTAQGQINGTVTNGAGASVTLTGPLTGITGFANEGTLSLASNDLTLGTLTGTGTGAVVQNGGSTDATLAVGSGNASGSYAGILRDGVGPGRLLFAKTGSGTLTLSGINTYTGATSVTAGTLVLAAGGSLVSDVAVANGAAFTNAGTLTAGLTSAGTAANSGAIAGLVTNTAGTLTNTGTLNGGASVTGGTLALGSGSIVNGALANSAVVTAQGQINGTVTNGAGARVTLTGPLTGITGFANEGTLSLASNDLALGTLTGTGTGAVVQNGGSTDATLTVGSGNASGSYAGILRDGVGPGRLLLAKTGNGTLTLAGANTYTGATTVAAGRLQAGAANAFSAGSAVTVASGATLDLAGNSQTIGSLAGGGTVTLGAGTLSAGADGTTTTFSGLASGAGGLTKVGAGTLTLSGANRYTGATTVSAGRLVLLGSVAGPVVNGARFDNGGTVGGGLANSGTATNTGTITGAVTNSGALTTSGALAGGLTNTGTVLASAGRLDGAIANRAGTLAITGPVTSDGTLANASGATLSIDASGRYRVAGLFSNAGSATNAGTLSADVTNAGGARFTNTGTVTALSQPFQNAGTLVSTGILSGGLANAGLAQVSGGLVGALANAGTLTLTGPTTGITAFANDGTADLGGTALSVGSLSGTRADAVLRNGRLTVGSDNTSTRYAGTIADGAGATSLTKVGSGTLTLSGTNTYTGATLVNAGTLDLRGTLASVVTVAGGAELIGSGAVGRLTVLDGASAGPGGAGTIGTLSVAGNVLFAAGSRYQVDVTASGQADRITASGTATLQGGTVQVTAGTGQYMPRTRYTLLSAAGGLNGQFAGVSSNFAFLTPTLSYDANDVTLTLARNDLQFASVAATRNQSAVAGAVQAAGVGTRLYDSVAVLSGAQARQAFDALSGEIHASAITAQFSTADFVREAIFDRLRFGPDRGPGGAGQIAPDPRSRMGLGASSLGQADAVVPAAYTADLPGRAPVLSSVTTRLVDPNPVSVWGQGFGAFGSVGGNGNAARLAQQTSGFVLGADSRIDGTWRLGVAGGYSYTSLDVAGRQSTGAAESGFGALYAGASYDAFQLRLGGAYTGTSLDVHRSATFAGFNETASARYGGALGQVFGEVGYRIASSAGYIEPFLGGAALRITRDGFTERGGAAALTAAGSDTDVATSTIGVQAQGQLDAMLGTGTPILVRGLVGYRRAYGDVVPTALFTFGASGQPFLTAGVPIARDALVVQGGLDWQFRPDTTLSVAYSGQIGSERTQEHSVKGSFLYRW